MNEIPTRSEKSWVKSKIARIGLSLLALGGMVGGVYEAYQNDLIPGVYHHIDVAPTFDNSQYSGAIGVNNTIEIDKNTLAKIPTTPAVPTPKHDVYLLLPIQDLPPDVNIAYKKTLPNEDMIGKFSPPHMQEAKEQNIKNDMTFKNVPKNTVILAPCDGELVFNSSSKIAPAIGAVNFFYKSPEGPLYQTMIYSNSKPLKPLIDVASYIILEHGTYRSEFPIPVKRGDPVAVTLQSMDVILFGQAWPSGDFSQADKIYLTNINLITLPDYLGQEKVAILGK